MTIYIHVDSTGTYPGNGGFLMLTLLACELHDMGYEVCMADPLDMLMPNQFAWMSLSETPFQIVSWQQAVDDTPDTPIITSWLRGLIPCLREQPHLIPRLRCWDHDELLRRDSKPSRTFVNEHIQGRIAITNEALKPYYQRLGMDNPLVLRNWVRDDFHDLRTERGANWVGFQSDRGHDRLFLRKVRQEFNPQLCMCVGDQAEVSQKMRSCAVFLWWNRPKPLIFEGEGFGLSMYEAMASGCVVVARRHPGNAEHGEIIPLFDDWYDAVQCVKDLQADPVQREDLRRRQAELVDTRYRFREAHKHAVLQLLEGMHG